MNTAVNITVFETVPILLHLYMASWSLNFLTSLCVKAVQYPIRLGLKRG